MLVLMRFVNLNFINYKKENLMETYIEAVHCTDDNFQGIEGRFGGSSEVQVVSIDKNGEVQRLRIGGADRKETVLNVVSVLSACLVSEGIANLKNGGFKTGTTEARLYNRCADFAAKIMELSSVEEPTSTEGGSADETTTIKTDDTVIDLRGDGSKPLLYIVGGTVVTPAELEDMRSIDAW
jgi:hypothetical protein